MRGLSVLLVVILLLAGAGMAADAYLTSTAEEQASRRVSAELDAPARVELRGWPVSLRLLSGRVPEVEITAADVPLEGGASLSRLVVVVQDVQVRLSDLRGAGALPVEGGAGRFEADLSEAAVNALVPQAPGAVVLGDGLATIDVAGQPVDVVVTVDEAGQIVLRPVSDVPGLAPITLPAPALPGEVVVERARVTPGVLTLMGRVTRLTR